MKEVFLGNSEKKKEGGANRFEKDTKLSIGSCCIYLFYKVVNSP